MFALNFCFGDILTQKNWCPKWCNQGSVFFFFQFCDVAEVAINRALDELAKSGYKQTMKVKLKRIHFVFWATYWDLINNQENFKNFILKKVGN